MSVTEIRLFIELFISNREMVYSYTHPIERKSAKEDTSLYSFISQLTTHPPPAPVDPP